MLSVAILSRCRALSAMAVATGVALIGCTPSTGGLRVHGDAASHPYGAIADVPAGTSYVSDIVSLCVPRGEVTVAGVRAAEHSADLRLEAWGLIDVEGGTDPPVLPGGLPGRLADYPEVHGREVGQRCTESAPFAAVVVQLSKTDAATAWVRTFAVDYLQDGRRRTITVPFLLKLCQPGVASNTCLHTDPGPS